jgi:hypothetical protein
MLQCQARGGVTDSQAAQKFHFEFFMTDGNTMNLVLVSVNHNPKKFPIKLTRKKRPTAL